MRAFIACALLASTSAVIMSREGRLAKLERVRAKTSAKLMMGDSPAVNATTWEEVNKACTDGSAAINIMNNIPFDAPIKITHKIIIGSTPSTKEHPKLSGRGTTRLFEVEMNGDLTLAQLKISHGASDDCGGGIFNRGHLVLDEVTVEDNTADESGGGVCNMASAIFEAYSSTFIKNSAEQGGAVKNEGEMTGLGNVIERNTAFQGGGVHNGGNITTTDTRFTSNTASGKGESCHSFRTRATPS